MRSLPLLLLAALPVFHECLSTPFISFLQNSPCTENAHVVFYPLSLSFNSFLGVSALSLSHLPPIFLLIIANKSKHFALLATKSSGGSISMCTELSSSQTHPFLQSVPAASFHSLSMPSLIGTGKISGWGCWVYTPWQNTGRHREPDKVSKTFWITNQIILCLCKFADVLSCCFVDCCDPDFPPWVSVGCLTGTLTLAGFSASNSPHNHSNNSATVT